MISGVVGVNQPTVVLHVMNHADERSAAQLRVIEGLADALDRRTHRLGALFLGEDGPLIAALRSRGVPANATPFTGLLDLRGALRLAGQARASRPAILHLHVGGRSRIGILRTATSAKVVMHLHSAVDDSGRELDLDRASRGAHAIVATSAAVARRIERNARVIHPGVALPERPVAEPAAAATVIGTVARLQAVKGLDVLLRALAALRESHPAVRLEVAGSGPLEAELRGLAGRLGVADAVSFLGWCDDVRALHQRWQVYVQPSRYEGLGIAALEAMGSSLPVVAFDSGGLSELVMHGRTGYLAPAGNSQTLADRLGELLDDSSKRLTFGRSGRRRAEECFSVEKMASSVADVYRRVLAR
ncbi:MAG: glycosyltransferase family 4 protein [Myxococcales bacterium]